jgi:hypothetical protein
MIFEGIGREFINVGAGAILFFILFFILLFFVRVTGAQRQ